MRIFNLFLSFYTFCFLSFKYMQNHILSYVICAATILLVSQTKREELRKHRYKIAVGLVIELIVVKFLVIPWL